MKVNLLKNAIMVAMASSILAGCGSDKGVDYNFKADNQVEFSDAEIVINLNEDSGIQVLDLLEGASANGKPLNSEDSTIFIREFIFSTPDNPAFSTPQATSPVTGQATSPFFIGEDPSKLAVQTDAFKEFLRFCDSTDERGALDADGNPTGDGIPDFPTSIKYNVQFIVDNGFTLPAGEEATPRVMSLTINAVPDPITGVAAADLDVPSGGSAQLIAQPTPAYSCDDKTLTYSIADTSIATVDSNGLVTGVSQGQTEVTITSVATNSSTTVKVNTTPGFNLAIVNQDLTDLGTPSGSKEVPSCSFAGVSVEPTIVNDDLTGEYTFSWMSENVDLPFLSEYSDGAFGATGVFSTGTSANVGKTTKVTVGYDSGYTGVTAGNNVLSQDVELTVVKNDFCEPGESANAAGWRTDFNLDGVPGWTGASAGSPASVTATSMESLDGTSLAFTSTNAETTSAVNGVFNKQRNYLSATYGLGADSIGKKFKFSVWAKLDKMPAAPITLKHVLFPWICEGEGCVTGPGYDRRRAIASALTAELKMTTDWQLVEFINPLTSTPVWTVPDHWSLVADVFQSYEIDGLPVDDILYLDAQTAVSVE
mgnify:FL=1